MIIGYITGQSLKIQAPVVVSDSINYLTAQFFFQTEDWQVLTKWAHFKQGENVYDFALENDRIEKDAHLNLSDGEWEVYLHGNEFADGEVVERITTEIVKLTVKKSGVLEGEPFAEQPASEVERINARLQRIEETGVSGAVSSVNGKTGAVKLTADDVGALSEDQLQPAIDHALMQAKESGEFKGDRGEKGDTGPQGLQGPEGEQGATGEQGPQGEKGEKGDKGEQGPQGEKGIDGVSVTHAWNDTTLVVTSASGTSSADLKGQKGEQGEQGEVGPQGPQGLQGLQGLQGPQGEAGPQGPQGLQGIQGIEGEKGEKGDTGAQGPKGDKGDPFSIAKIYRSVSEMNEGFLTDGVEVGRFVLIDTGNVDDPDNATMYVKSDTNYSFVTDLSGAQGMQGPQGEKGEKGDKGDKGDQGSQGVQGEQGPQGEKGETGPKGDTGETGPQGPQGIQGPKGDTGATGSDGVSVTHSWNGTVLTITSASGTSSSDLKGFSAIDPTPTAGSQNPVTSGGVQAAIADSIEIFYVPFRFGASGFELDGMTHAEILAAYNAGKRIIGKANVPEAAGLGAWGEFNIPMTCLRNSTAFTLAFLSGKTSVEASINTDNSVSHEISVLQNIDSRVTAINSSANHTSYPTAKAVYDYIESRLNGLTFKSAESAPTVDDDSVITFVDEG